VTDTLVVDDHEIACPKLAGQIGDRNELHERVSDAVPQGLAGFDVAPHGRSLRLVRPVYDQHRSGMVGPCRYRWQQ